MEGNLNSTTAAGSWEHFPHAADVGVRGNGGSLAEAFVQGALAMMAVVTPPVWVEPRLAVSIACEAPDVELLFVDWLNALIYEMSTRHMVFGRFEVKIEDTRLHAVARGEPLNVVRHDPAVEVKGATYTDLSVRKLDDGQWLAQCVVDV